MLAGFLHDGLKATQITALNTCCDKNIYFINVFQLILLPIYAVFHFLQLPQAAASTLKTGQLSEDESCVLQNLMTVLTNSNLNTDKHASGMQTLGTNLVS